MPISESLEFEENSSDSDSTGTGRKFRSKLTQVMTRPASETSSFDSIIETDFLREYDGNGNKEIFSQYSDVWCDTLDSSISSFHEDPLDQSTCWDIAKRLRSEIHRARIQHDCEVLLPINMLEKMSEDIVRMSQCEPCGLRGCVIHISIQRKNLCHKLDQIVMDDGTISTFEIFLTLKEDSKKWSLSFKNLFRPSLSSDDTNAQWGDEIFISPGYQLVKNKLYRSTLSKDAQRGH